MKMKIKIKMKMNFKRLGKRKERQIKKGRMKSKKIERKGGSFYALEVNVSAI